MNCDDSSGPHPATVPITVEANHKALYGGITGVEARDRHEHSYDSGWRLVEMQDNATPSNRTLSQFVYGTQYIDEPVVYDRNTDVSADDDCLEAAGSQRYTYHQDANYRVVMLTGEDGAVVERYQYTAYGEPTVYLGGATEAGNSLPVSTVGNPFMHQGLFCDRETGSYQNRFRQLHSPLGRFMQLDPLGIASGASRYAYLSGDPVERLDPFGLQSEGESEREKLRRQVDEWVEEWKRQHPRRPWILVEPKPVAPPTTQPTTQPTPPPTPPRSKLARVRRTWRGSAGGLSEQDHVVAMEIIIYCCFTNARGSVAGPFRISLCVADGQACMNDAVTQAEALECICDACGP